MHTFRNAVAKQYGTAQDLEQKQRRLLAAFLKWKQGSLIELACGNGKVLQDISEVNTNLDITWIDYNEAMIEEAKKHLPEVTFIQWDILHIQEYISEQKFDFVVCLNSLHNLPSVAFIYQTLQTMHTIVAKNWYVCFDIRNKRNPFIRWSYRKNRQKWLCFFPLNPYSAVHAFTKDFKIIVHQGIAYTTLQEAWKEKTSRFFRHIYRIYMWITTHVRFFAPYHFIILQKK